LGRYQPAVHRSVLVIDVEKFGDPARTNADQVAVQDGMYLALEGALASAGVSRQGCVIEDRGDGALVLISPEVPKSWLVTRLPVRLAAALGDHNAACSVNARIRLRMALHAGEIHPDGYGVTGSAVNRTFRLVEAPALKSALDDSAGMLALIVSDWFYDEVVRHEPAAEPECYRPVHAVVKEKRAAAWIRVLEVPAGKSAGRAESVTGEHLRRPVHSGAAGRKTGAALSGRSRLAPPRQLPSSPLGFVGREDELAQLDSLFPAPGRRRTRPVVIAAIHGMAGVGKTALAVHWGHQVARRFPDGQLYTDLRGHSARAAMTPGEVLGRQLRALGIPDRQIPAEEEEQAALYRSLLAGRRVLVVLDNAATPDQVRPLLPGSAGCMAVVTSRCRLSGLAARDGAQRINLDVLPAAQAVAVLAQSAGAARVHAEPAAAQELARLCGRLPLALRIAAERVASRRRSALADLAGELTDTRSRLDLLCAGDDDAAAVRTVFSWSYRTLPPAAAGAFRSLGLLAGPDFSAPAVAALIGADMATARQLLEFLAGMYLVEESGEDRYRLHDLLRLYAAERALAEDGDEGRAAARRRVLDWYLYTAYAANSAITHDLNIPLDAPAECCTPLTFTTIRQALDWYETEQANLMASIRMAAETGHHGAAWKIPATMWGHFLIRKPWHDVITAHQLGLAAAREIGDRTGEAYMLGFLGYAHRVRRPEEASRYCHQALAVFGELGDRRGQAYVLNFLGLAHRELRRSEEAIGYCDQSLAICRELGDRLGQARYLTSMSAILRGLRRSEEAIGYCR
jgi:NB-ARC domain/Tetratricopeptide repeat